MTIISRGDGFVGEAAALGHHPRRPRVAYGGQVSGQAAVMEADENLKFQAGGGSLLIGPAAPKSLARRPIAMGPYGHSLGMDNCPRLPPAP